MGIALVSAGAVASTATPSFGQATASGDLLICWLFTNNSSATFADSLTGAGWVNAASGGTSFDWASVYFKANCGSGETAPTVSTGGSAYNVALAEFSGAVTSSPLDSHGGDTGAGTSTATATNAVSDAAGGDLIVFAAGFNSGATGGTFTNTMADSSGASVTPTVYSGTNSAGASFYYDFMWGVAGATGANKDTATSTVSVFSSNEGGAIASFKAAATAAAAVPLSRAMQLPNFPAVVVTRSG